MADKLRLTHDETGDLPETWQKTRRALHAVAELVLAGPQYRESGTIRLRVSEAGIDTVARPELAVRVVDDTLVLAGTPYRLAAADPESLVTTTCAALATAAGVEPGAPEGLYHDGSGVRPADEIEFNPLVASILLDRLRVGAAGLRMFAPEETAVLWPEHFDVGVTLDEVNYGVSLGDGYEPWPYAYVGPWEKRDGEFWNAPFGAVRRLAEAGEAAGVAEFFEQGRRVAAGG